MKLLGGQVKYLLYKLINKRQVNAYVKHKILRLERRMLHTAVLPVVQVTRRLR